MTPRAENINPTILKWARETAGMSLEEAARRLGFTSRAKRASAGRLEALERGETKPTRNQLLKIAATYRRPLTAFYRTAPPVPGNRGEDFRSIGGVIDKSEPLLDALLRTTRVRQDLVRSILEDDEDTECLSFVGSMPITEPIEDAAATIRVALHLDETRHPRVASSAEQFATLRERVEALGVFVLLVGNLGSHHTNLDERVFRGFAVADQIAPFIIINDQDATAAQSFTLIHELVHVYTGSTGVSAAPAAVPPRTHRARVERFCNDIASEVLLPHNSLPKFQGSTVGAAADQISRVAVARNVSEAMVAYRYWRIGELDAETYRRLEATYAARWQTARARRREHRQEAAGTGPTYYMVRKHRLGRPLINLVGRALRSDELTHTKAALILGVKPSGVEPLLGGLGAGSPTRQSG